MTGAMIEQARGAKISDFERPALDKHLDKNLAKIFPIMEVVVREAGTLALQWFKPAAKTHASILIKQDDSPVTQADMAVNHFLREKFASAFPDFGWLSEESEDTTARLQKDFVLIVDPIDGTRGFIDGNPHFAVSVGLSFQGKIVAGLVHCPALDACYHAVIGQGAFCNATRIFAKLGKPLPIEAASNSSPQAEALTLFGPRSTLTRLNAAGHAITITERLPSLACRLIKIAEGVIDGGLVSGGANDWDIAGAAIILAEAGACLCTQSGDFLNFNETNTTRPPLVASCHGYYAAIAALAKEAVFPS